MARGDMRYASTDIRVSGEEILNREVFEGIPMTIDFSDVSTTNDDTGEKVVRAGSVISGTGTVVAATPWTSTTRNNFKESLHQQETSRSKCKHYL